MLCSRMEKGARQPFGITDVGPAPMAPQTVAALDPVVYSVAKGQGLVPLPELAAASDTDDLHCGLLRGLNGTKMLETIGSGRAATGAAAGGMGVTRHARSRRSRARVLQQLVMKQAAAHVVAPSDAGAWVERVGGEAA